jgi:hypothetical protein
MRLADLLHADFQHHARRVEIVEGQADFRAASERCSWSSTAGDSSRLARTFETGRAVSFCAAPTCGDSVADKAASDVNAKLLFATPRRIPSRSISNP